MRSFHSRTSRFAGRAMRRAIGLLLVPLLVAGLLPLGALADGAPAPAVRYSFLDAFSGSGGLFALGDLTAAPATTRNKAYGAAISATAIGQARSFQFTVPASGHYLISFQGYLYFKSGIGELSVDGAPIGRYDFYDPGSRFGPDTPMKTVWLEAGGHVLTLTVVGRNPAATTGSNYSMYASALTLVPMPGPAELRLTSEPSKTLLLPGETATMRTTVSMSDGTAVTNPRFGYASGDESVVTVDVYGTIRAIGRGTASITTSLASDQGNASVSSTVTVSDGRLAEVAVALDPPELFVGGASRIALSGKLTDGTPADLSQANAVFSVDDPSIASVSPQGVLTGLKTGATVVRASVTFNGSTAEGQASVVVTPKTLASVEVRPEKATITVDEYAKTVVTGKFDDGTEADLTGATFAFATDSAGIAGIDPLTGTIEGKAAGQAVVSATVTLGGTTRTGSATVTVQPLVSDKTRSTIYTPAKVANARDNAARYDWAKSIRDAAAASADPFVALGYEFLWNIVPPQTLPRSYGVNQVMGSPVTGREIDKYGNYPYLADPVGEPWKIVDPSSGYKFPTNDFGAYYRSGLDEQGVFRPERADRSLLVNTLYPEKGPTWGVDDGYGWVDDKGNRYTFISYYVHWHLWYSSGIIQRAVRSLRDAYVFTGDIRYARAGIVLLDRIADVYPSLDASAYDPTIYLQSAQGTGTGKAVGSIWETSLVKDFLSAYDAFYPAMDDPEAIAFLSAKGREHKLSWKHSGTGLRRNAEQGIVRQVFPGVKASQIRGNVGMHQSALAMAAVVLDTFPDTKEWLDFNNQAGGLVANPWRVTGGNLLASLVNDVDRDGHGNESAPGYNRLWLNNFLQVADVLYGYDKYPQADLYDNVKLRKMFHAMYPLLLSEKYMPPTGDSEMTGNPGLSGLDSAQMIKAFEAYGDPIFAQLAHFLNNNSADGIHGDIFSADPERVAGDIEAVIEEHGPLDLGSSNLTGYGFTALRDGDNDKRKYGTNYGFPQLAVTSASTAYNTYASTATVQLEATTPGHSIGFRFEAPRTDTYHVRLKPFRAASYGIYRVSIDGQFVKEIDFFGTLKDPELLQVMTLSAGEHTISFENSGRNASANNYKMGVTELQLLTAEEAAKADAARNTLRDAYMYYGRSSGHGHRDTLNIGLHAYGLDLAPDLGYPEFADNVDMHRAQWVNNTVSHNTVVVDKRKQQTQWVGLPHHYDETEQVKLVDVEAPKPYPQTERYRRTMATIRVDAEHSYTVDFFRVKGGSDHHYSFHGPEGTVSTEGLALTAQPTGTYAGPNVAFGQRADDVEGAGYMGSGFHWLKDVERDGSPTGAFSVDWKANDTWNVFGRGAGAETDVHLRLTMLGPVDDVALANGVPPRNKPGNPQQLRYMLAHRTGANLDSLFTSVLEPYKGERYVRSIAEAEVKRDGVPVDTSTDNGVRAIKVELANGRTDYIVQASDASATYTIDGKLEFRGFFGVYSEKDGRTMHVYLNDGTTFGRIGETPLRSAGALQGAVVDFTRELAVGNEIVAELDLQGVDPSALAGRTAYVANDKERNAVYAIRSVTPLGGGRYRLDIGDATLVRRFVDSNDFSKGYVYDIAPGAALRIPLSAEASVPVTEAAVAGPQTNGWYTGDVTVTLHVYGDPARVSRTEYSLDGGEAWSPYGEPIVLADSGRHTVHYRSVNDRGETEAAKSVEIPIDRDAPAFVLTANGIPAAEGTVVVEDGEPVRLELTVTDPLSGVAVRSMTVTDAVYGNGTYADSAVVDWSGRPGAHIVRVEAADAAGHTVAADVTVRVTTSLDSIGALTERFIAAGDVRGPLVPQLRNALEQAKHHYGKGSVKQASSHLERYAMHLNNGPMRQHVSESAKAALAADADYLLRLWANP
ncbi:FIMAH domain-containing protein [Paenibacillus flagellatus]|uniref:BIG2 domain-containing protein n=1 Tax=Paenibacillus flagellatus TaxID=2211139 RepID=A0A2V5KR21_9BACL|nr:heparinase II/III family protein [Paenibacillus flagellatus]PYI53807.1 hypothetical protein DLM86_14715 [Paenibacillus flagellatus]